jgi:flagellin FlaB
MIKFYEIVKRKDVGAIGIGAMIVFIAMVLVAGIAASVLVQTANRLEIQAMTTGEETTAEVATGLRVVDIEGQKASRYINRSGTFTWRNNTLHNMTITIAPRAGSNDIDLSKTILEISNSTVKCILNYTSDAGNRFAAQPAAAGVFSTTDTGSVFDNPANAFSIIELEDADSSCSETTPVINRGDKVMLCVNLTACFQSLSTRTDVWGMVIPEEGSSGMFSFRTPASYTDTVYDLY